MNKIIIITILVSFIILVLPLSSANDYNQTIPEFSGSTQYLYHYENKYYFAPELNSKIYLNLLVNTSIIIYGIQFLGNDMALNISDYSLVLFSIGNNTHSQINVKQNISLLSITMLSGTTINIDGKIYHNSTIANNLTISGYGDFVYAQIFENFINPNNTQLNNLPVLIGILFLVFVVLSIIVLLIRAPRNDYE